MGSSPGSDLQTPPQQPTPQGVISPGVGMQDYQPSFQSYLPSNPNAMATGLTPQMFAPQQPPASAAPAAAGGAPPGAGGPSRDDLAAMMAMSALRDRKTQEVAGKHFSDGFDVPGYIDKNYPMPKAPMAGPAQAR